MLSLERGVETPSYLIDYGKWHVREVQFSTVKVQWLWAEMQKYPTLFSDLSRNNEEIFVSVVQDRFSYWLEVVDDNENILGMMYITELFRAIDANVHLIFFDRKPSEKAPLVREMIRLVFDKFPYLNRLTATIPSIYHATFRLSKKAGFVEEGRKRQSILIRHEWCDEIILGILAREV